IIGGEVDVVFQVALDPHLVAGLDRAGIGDPAGKVLGVVFQQAAGNGGAGADVGQVRIGDADAFVATDVVAAGAGLDLEEVPALGDKRRILLLFRKLFGAPGVERRNVKLVAGDEAGLVLLPGSEDRTGFFNFLVLGH